MEINGFFLRYIVKYVCREYVYFEYIFIVSQFYFLIVKKLYYKELNIKN